MNCQQKAQLLEKERLEREKQEQASKWLKENFRRDGETGTMPTFRFQVD